MGVQEMVENGLSAIPSKYVKPEDSQPQSQIQAANIPTIDLSKFHGDDKPEVVKAIAEAASKWGFLQVVNHGVSSSTIKDMKDAANTFFHLPADEKMRFYSDDLKKPLRYGTSFAPYAETSLDWHDYLGFRFPLQGAWPEELDFYEKASTNYLESIKAMADVIAAALSLGLGLEPQSFAPARQVFTSRVNYYPECPAPELALGISPHSDFGGFTVLMQDIGGLQVKNEGEWYLLEPIPDAFIINIADQLEIMSNGKYKSAEHRAVVNSTQPRMSVVTFINPDDDEFIEPLKELGPACYKGIVFGEYMKQQFSKHLDSKSGVAALKI